MSTVTITPDDNSNNEVKNPVISIETEQDLGFCSIIPQINYNHHFFEIELRWLFWMIAFRHNRKFKKKQAAEKQKRFNNWMCGVGAGV